MSLHRAHLPGSPARNGLPFLKPYVYRGTGDLRPDLTDADLRPYQTDSGRQREDACPDCGYKQGGRNCRVMCREIRRERLLEAAAECYGASR